MKKIRPSKHTANGAIKHLPMKPKTQFPSLKARCLVKNNRISQSESACQAGGKCKHLRGCSRAKQGLRKKKKVEMKHQGFIEGCRKSANFLIRR